MSKERVPEKIVDVSDDYDIVSFQEIRDIDNIAFPQLMIELDGYSYVISERKGRSSSKEQYAFIYKNKISFLSDNDLVDERFERPPYEATFSYNGGELTLVTLQSKHKNIFRTSLL